MDPLPWNGSDIGDISDRYVNSISSKDHYGVYLYLRPNIICLAFKYTSPIPLLIDELKPLFGLPKLGRNKCRLNDEDVLIQKVDYFSEGPSKPSPNDLSLYDKRQVQRFYAFRYLFCLSSHNQNDFWFRENVGYISYYELSVKPDDTLFPKDSFLKKWFPETNMLNSTIQNILQISPLYRRTLNPNKDVLDCIPKIKSKIDEIIKRIDPEYINLSSQFYYRATKIIYD